MAWTQEQKDEAIAAYVAGEPTPETSTELIKELAEQFKQSPNGLRMILVQAGVYVKKDPAVKSDTKAGTKTGEKTEGTKRVSKDDQIAALRSAIEAAGKEVDEDVISKLTGKAAAYFLTLV